MKFRSADINLYLNQLRSKGYEIVSVEETHRSRRRVIIYVLVNKETASQATVYKTANSWIEITYSKLR